MTNEPASSPALPNDPAIPIAERQLSMLAELAQIAMAVSRAFGASAIASADTAKGILTDPYFMPEIGRARACGAKEAAESFQKVSRSLRLTLMLETATAEALRDLRAGVVTPRSASGCADEGVKPARIVIDGVEAPVVALRDAEDEGVTARLERPGAERERAFDLEYPERLPKGAYVSLVDNLAADVGATVDWDASTVSADRPGWTEAGAPSPAARPHVRAARDRAVAYSP